jgi:NTE family protein
LEYIATDESVRSKESLVSDPKVMDCLRSSSVFGWLDEATLQDLVQRFEHMKLAADSILMSLGDAADALYVVIEGELEARARSPGGAELTLSTMGPGSTVGEIPLLFGGPRTATVRAIVDTMLLRISRADVEELSARSRAAFSEP